MPTPEQVNDLHERIEILETRARDRETFNYNCWALLVLLSLGLVTATAIAGIGNNAKLAAILAILNGFVIAVEAAFAFGQARQSYRAIGLEVQALGSRLVDIKSAADYDALKKEYQQLHLRLNKVPMGGGAQAGQVIAPRDVN